MSNRSLPSSVSEGPVDRTTEWSEARKQIGKAEASLRGPKQAVFEDVVDDPVGRQRNWTHHAWSG